MSTNWNSSTPSIPGGNTAVTFQTDAEGNFSAYVPTPATPMGDPVENGTLILQLAHDGKSATPNQVVANFRVPITLNSSGQISPAVAIYSNTGLLPASTFYYATLYTSDGTLAIPRSTVTIPNSPNPVDLSTLTWGPAI